ncbi:MAG: hypothetical protein IJC06_00355 [Clostridia bacterium]|nr:hypothetical protein [Clostridia bacterium]
MKEVNVTFSQQGKIADIDNANIFFEGEDNSIKINATFPDGIIADAVFAYIYTASGVQEMVTPEYVDNKYVVVLEGRVVEKGVLKIGFEVQKDQSFMRFMPLVLQIDGFISDDYIIANKLYSVSVAVDETNTCESDLPATVENVGNSKQVRLKFTIPKGEKGEKGEQGEKGEKGDRPCLGIDYWTPEDKLQLQSYVDDYILNGSW